jgi:hypothetical protein
VHPAQRHPSPSKRVDWLSRSSSVDLAWQRGPLRQGVREQALAIRIEVLKPDSGHAASRWKRG